MRSRRTAPRVIAVHCGTAAHDGRWQEPRTHRPKQRYQQTCSFIGILLFEYPFEKERIFI